MIDVAVLPVTHARVLAERTDAHLRVGRQKREQCPDLARRVHERELSPPGVAFGR